MNRAVVMTCIVNGLLQLYCTNVTCLYGDSLSDLFSSKLISFSKESVVVSFFLFRFCPCCFEEGDLSFVIVA